MRTKKRIRLILLITVMVVFPPVFQGGIAISGEADLTCAALSLQDAIDRALEKNPGLAAARHRVSASAERIVQARSGFYPQVYVTEAWQQTTNPMWAFGLKLNQGIITQQDFDPALLNDPSAIDNFNTLLWMNWPLFDSGQTWFGSLQADLSHQAEAASLSRTRQEIVSQTVAAYTNLVFAKESVAVVDQALNTAEAHHRQIENRYKSGLTVKSDLLRAQVHVSELEQQRVEAESHYFIAQAVLCATMGEETPGDVAAVTPLVRKGIIEKSLDEWMDKARNSRPDLVALKFQEESARAEIKKTRAAHWPSVNLNGSYEVNSDDFDETANNYTVGANVTLNLFSGNGMSARHREALHRSNEIAESLRAVRQKIQLETREAYYQVRSAEKWILAAEMSVDAAQEALRIVENRYDNGQVPLVSLLDAEMTVIRARNNLNQALKDHVQSRARLALAAGELNESFE